jgi:glutamine cyclotransferase
MKKILFASFFIVLLFSCRKEEYPTNPDWLNDKISQMAEPATYMGTTIYAYEWKNEYYYHIQIPVSSCGYCEFYKYNGKKYAFTSDTFTDFMNNGKKLRIVWQRS